MTGKKTFYLFDMDGTLTPARLPMTECFAQWFRNFIGKNIVYIASGSDVEKIKSQIPTDIFGMVAGVYASMGNEFYKYGQQVYKKQFTPEAELLDILERYRKSTQYFGRLFPNYIEPRCGMINFSVLGRDCPHEERIKYKTWDDTHKERARIQKTLADMFKGLDISLGGNISIDIVPKGFGKEQVADHLRSEHPAAQIVFVGDRTEEGGNDYTLAQRLLALGNTKIIKVNGPEDVPAALGV